VCAGGQAHLLAVAGEQCGMQLCVGSLQWAGSKVPLPTGIWTAIEYKVTWATRVYLQNGISNGSGVFAPFIHVPNTQTAHAMHDVCSSRPLLCTVWWRCGLKRKNVQSWENSWDWNKSGDEKVD